MSYEAFGIELNGNTVSIKDNKQKPKLLKMSDKVSVYNSELDEQGLNHLLGKGHHKSFYLD